MDSFPFFFFFFFLLGILISVSQVQRNKISLLLLKTTVKDNVWTKSYVIPCLGIWFLSWKFLSVKISLSTKYQMRHEVSVGTTAEEGIWKSVESAFGRGCERLPQRSPASCQLPALLGFLLCISFEIQQDSTWLQSLSALPVPACLPVAPLSTLIATNRPDLSTFSSVVTDPPSCL